MICPNSWVDDQAREKYGAFDHYPCAKEHALNIGIKCSNSVIISLSTMFNLQFSFFYSNIYYVFINAQLIRHMAWSFVCIFTGAFVPIYVGISTSFLY